MMSFAAQELWMQAMQERRAQQCVALIESASGVYAYGKHLPRDEELADPSATPYLDGALLLDGSWGLTGALRLIDRGARVLNWSDVEYTLTPDSGELISGLSSSEMSEYSVTLNNADAHLSRVFALESWLGATMRIRVGFRGLNYSSFLLVFSGQVTRIRLAGTSCDVTALNNL